MTRTLGAGMTTDIAAATAEATELLFLDFADLSNNPTPIYVTTAGQNISWNGQTWLAVGGHLAIDALGESTDGPSDGVRLNLSGVDQALLAEILGARYRGRTASVYYAHLDQAVGTVKTDPVLMFTGLMNGGFDTSESRGDFGGGTVDISLRLTAKLNELVKVRGVRTNLASHRTAIPGASADTFFQNVPQLPLRKVFWGVKVVVVAPPPVVPPSELQPMGPGGFPGSSGGPVGPGGLYPSTPGGGVGPGGFPIGYGGAGGSGGVGPGGSPSIDPGRR